MDITPFDRLARTFAPSRTRRTALRALLAAGGTALGLAGGQRAAAQGCLGNGTRCQDGTECCSGRCEGQVCQQADNQGVCTIQSNACSGASRSCGRTHLGNCSCYVTTEGYSFCGTRGRRSLKTCGCTSDRDCVRRVGFGKGARCVLSGLQYCGCPAGPQGTCVKRCRNLDSQP